MTYPIVKYGAPVLETPAATITGQTVSASGITLTTAAASRGTSFGAATPGEVELAEELVARTPVEKVRLVNSGNRLPGFWPRG